MKIRMAHGGGGKETMALVNDLIRGHLGNDILDRMEDGAVFHHNCKTVFTTDSFVVKPLFFPGGDIGKLSVCGTINDISVMGAIPEYLSLSLIIEEGFPLTDLKRIIESIAAECGKEDVKVACGDTKVVEKGSGDGLFINTSGIGRLRDGVSLSISNVEPGDVILINGFVGEHGAAILGARKELNFVSDIESDCAPLTSLVSKILTNNHDVHAMRDPTRGGLAAVVNEMGLASGVTICVDEEKVPVSQKVASVCDLLGISPLELANEGKVVVALRAGYAKEALGIMRSHPLGKNAQIIGFAEERGPFPSVLKNGLGARTILEMPRGEHLPRIC